MSKPTRPLRIAMFGLSITSSWGNGHATTYRSLVKGLDRRGHHVTFYERRQPWYEANRDLRHSNLCEIVLYDCVEELARSHRGDVAAADVVLIGSYLPDGIRVAEWVLNESHAVTAFYDIDTPVTVAALSSHTCTYLDPRLVPEFDLYLSFSGGPILRVLEKRFGARRAMPLYCSVDCAQYRPIHMEKKYHLGYLGTYSADRQPKVDLLLNEPARLWPQGKLCAAGAQYPDSIDWPSNVTRIDHVAPTDHCVFYNSQRFTLNVTRRDMVEHGFSPSVRLFEAAACGVPILSDYWNGLETYFEPDSEILIVETAEDVLRALRDTPTAHAAAIGKRARTRVLREHTAEHRALEFEQYVESCRFAPDRVQAARRPARPVAHPVAQSSTRP